MRFPPCSRPVRLALDDRFYCRSKRRVVVRGQCMDGYVEANAFERARSSCYRCPDGAVIRDAYAADGDRVPA